MKNGRGEPLTTTARCALNLSKAAHGFALSRVSLLTPVETLGKRDVIYVGMRTHVNILLSGMGTFS